MQNARQLGTDAVGKRHKIRFVTAASLFDGRCLDQYHAQDPAGIRCRGYPSGA